MARHHHRAAGVPQPAATDAHVRGGTAHIGGKTSDMDKIDPDIVAVEVHAGAAHMKGVVGTSGWADVLGCHLTIFGYSNTLYDQYLESAVDARYIIQTAAHYKPQMGPGITLESCGRGAETGIHRSPPYKNVGATQRRCGHVRRIFACIS